MVVDTKTNLPVPARPGVRVLGAAIFLLLWGVPGFAAPPLVLDDGVSMVTLGRYLDYLADPGGRLGIAEVASDAMASRFVAVGRDVPNFGISRSAYWFRITIERRTDGRPYWIGLDQPLMDHADLYLPNPDGSFAVQHSGDMRPMSARTIPRRAILFSLPPGTGRITCYLRGQIEGRSQFPLFLYSDERLRSVENLHNAAYGGFLGFALTIALICLSLFFFIREKSFIYYAGYILATAVYHLTISGYLFSAVFPEHPRIHDYWVPLVCFLPLVGATLFVREFLTTPRNAPLMDKPLRIWLRVNLVLPPLVFFIPMATFKSLLILDALLIALLLIVASLEAVRNGYRPARYLLAARIGHEISVIMFMLVSFDLIPYSPYCDVAMLISPLLDGILIAFAQGERFNLLNRQVRGLVSDLQHQVDERTAANTALQEEMAERQRLEHEVAQVSDNERLRLGHDLHDGLCQQLGAARLHCTMIEEDMAEGTSDIDSVKMLGGILEDAVRESYAIAKGLCPLDLDPESLVPALQRLLANVEISTDIECEFRHDETVSIADRERVVHIYRIAQEAVANAVKHAKPTRIVMELRCADGQVRLSVADNGCGLGQSQGPTPGGMGLRIMSYRVRTIGGELGIEQTPGGGTRVVCVANIDV